MNVKGGGGAVEVGRGVRWLEGHSEGWRFVQHGEPGGVDGQPTVQV